MFLTYLTLNTHVRCTYLPVNSSYSDIQIITKLNVIHVLRSQTLLRLQDHTTQPTCILSTQVQFIHVKSIVTVHILQTHNTYINHRYTKLNLFQTHTIRLFQSIIEGNTIRLSLVKLVQKFKPCPTLFKICSSRQDE